MLKKYSVFFLLCLLSVGAHAQSFGYVEKVLLANQYLLKAKLDTGAKSASLNAHNIKLDKEEGTTWVHFKVPTKSGDVSFKEKLVGYVRIKARYGENQLGMSKKTFKRPLVAMNITLGKQTQPILMNLTNRGNFNYPILLGRDALKAFNATINPQLKFTQKPQAN